MHRILMIIGTFNNIASIWSGRSLMPSGKSGLYMRGLISAFRGNSRSPSRISIEGYRLFPVMVNKDSKLMMSHTRKFDKNIPPNFNIILVSFLASVFILIDTTFQHNMVYRMQRIMKTVEL